MTPTWRMDEKKPRSTREGNKKPITKFQNFKKKYFPFFVLSFFFFSNQKGAVLVLALPARCHPPGHHRCARKQGANTRGALKLPSMRMHVNRSASKNMVHEPNVSQKDGALGGGDGGSSSLISDRRIITGPPGKAEKCRPLWWWWWWW